jgi:hypothetical protein
MKKVKLSNDLPEEPYFVAEPYSKEFEDELLK